MTVAQDLFTTGLKNAHAMENQALAIMRPQVERIEHYPEVADRLNLHIRETEAQITRLEELLDSVGSDRSMLKDAALSLAGTMASLGHTIAPDEVVKNSFANHAFENFEIAAYRSLLALSDAAGVPSANRLLQQTLDEEVAMAEWILTHVEPLTLRFLTLKEEGERAKT